MMNTYPPAILLFGMPRSGTTWIGKIFDSHPATLYRHEPDSWGELNSVPLIPSLNDVDTNRAAVNAFVARLPAQRKTKVSASLPIFPKNGESQLGWKLRRAMLLGIKASSRLFGEIRTPAFLDGVGATAVPVWKSIESTARLGLIMRCLPDTARAIHIIRHPCGFVSSVLRGEKQNKFENGKDSEDFGMFEQLCTMEQAKRRGLTLAAFHDMRPAQRLAWRWLLVNEKTMEECAGIPGYMALNYDALCADPIQGARKMFTFTGLDWNPQTEGFLGSSTTQDNAAYYSIFKSPLKSANKWKSELSETEQADIMEIVHNTQPGALFES